MTRKLHFTGSCAAWLGRLVRQLSSFAWREEIERGEVAIRSWDEERLRALREAARVTRLLRVAEDMLSTYRDDAREVLVTTERMEAWRHEIDEVMSHAAPDMSTQEASTETKSDERKP